jgi:NADPH:quinone reductase-like Zn-dependent oxidoreductase
MRTLRFHEYGEPADVLRLERAPVPSRAAGRVRVAVSACGLNPADWALCRGLFPGQLPRGVGLDVAGIVDAIGQGVGGLAIGDRVVGSADFAGCTSAGASEFASLDHWARVPANLDLVQAAALPMAVETAYRHLDLLRVTAGQSVLVHGAGSAVGFAAVQIALLRGARVIATAGDTYAERLRAKGALVTSYGEGMAERIQKLAAGPVDLALDTAPVPADPELVHRLIRGSVKRSEQDTAPTSGPLADLVRAAGGDPRRVVTLGDVKSATRLGARTSFDLLRGGVESPRTRSDVLGEFVLRAADGTFTVPIARTFALEDWRAALDVSQSGRARGKLVLLPSGAAA